MLSKPLLVMQCPIKKMLKTVFSVMQRASVGNSTVVHIRNCSLKNFYGLGPILQMFKRSEGDFFLLQIVSCK